MKYGLGVDIGGTKIASAIIDEFQNIIHIEEVSSKVTNEEDMYQQVVKSIKQVLMKSNLKMDDISGLGVGVPGKVDRENGVAIYQNNIPWADFPIAARLKEDFSIKNLTIDNDVYMAAYAEWKSAGSSSGETFVYITVSTGVSAAIIHKGDFVRGAGFAGELGLFPVYSADSESTICDLEKVASGPAIKKQAEKMLHQKNIETSEFFDLYTAGNIEAERLMKHIAGSLAHGIYSVICLLDPQRIIFGGGVMNNQNLLLELVKKELLSFLIPQQIHALDRMHSSNLKENSGVIGAALRGIDSTLNREVKREKI